MASLRPSRASAGRLQIWTDLGRAQRTTDAYASRLAECLKHCQRNGVDPLAADRAQVAPFVRDLTRNAGHRGPNTLSLDSGGRRANATLQKRLIPICVFHDFLGDEGLSGSTEQHWLDVLAVFRDEPIRNRLILAVAYDAALRRDELCSPHTDDLDPRHQMIRVRAKTNKTRRGGAVPYLAATTCCSPPTWITVPDHQPHLRPTVPRGARFNRAESKVVRRVTLSASVP